MRVSHRLTLDEIRQRQCGSKVRHQTRARARRAKRDYERRHGVKMSAYKCSWCGFYHVGHKYPKVEVEEYVSCPQGEIESGEGLR